RKTYNIYQNLTKFSKISHSGFSRWNLRKRFPRMKGDFLGVLSIGFDVTSVDKLTCHVVPWFASVTKTLHSRLVVYQRLILLIRRLERVSRISFHFDQRNLLDFGEWDDDTYQGWVIGFNELLNVCIEKGCKDLRIYDWTYPLGTRSVNFRDLVVGKLVSFSNLNSKFLPSPPPPSLSVKARSATQDVNRFRISAPVLLCAPHSSWTFQFLSASPLTSLILENLKMTPQFWIEAFSLLVSPLQAKLESLKIRNCDNIPPSPLINFIDKFLGLTDLTLLAPLPPFHNERKRIGSSHLTSICAPLDFFSLLRVQSPNSLLRGSWSYVPKNSQLEHPPISTLKTIHILPRCPTEGQQPCDCNTKAEELLMRYSNVPVIVWNLELSNIGNLNEVDDSNRDFLAQSSFRCGLNSPSPASAYKYITDIVLSAAYVTQCTSRQETFDFLLAFLQRFAGLKRVRIVGRMKSTKDDKWMKMVDTSFLRKLKRRCRLVKRVVLQGSDGKEVVYDMQKVQ
ncbi:hypothetical protein BDN72DRAFT_126044, partial [Pluteus cervinus]